MVTMRTTSCRAPILLFFCVWTHTSPPKKCAFHVYLLTGHLSAPVEVVKALKVICIKTNAPSDQRLWGTSSVLTLKTYKLSVFSMMSFSWFLGQYFSISHSNFIGNYIAIFVGAPAGALMLPKEKPKVDCDELLVHPSPWECAHHFLCLVLGWKLPSNCLDFEQSYSNLKNRYWGDNVSELSSKFSPKSCRGILVA